jgi:hypothetical protein
VNSPSSSAETGSAFPASGCVTETETVRMAVMNSAAVSDSGGVFPGQSPVDHREAEFPSTEGCTCTNLRGSSSRDVRV